MAGTWVFYYVQGDEGKSVGALNALKVSTPGPCLSSSVLKACC
jgi:hypothetical protein